MPGTLPHTGFQIFRTGDRKTLSISPVRLGERPNVSLGMAMITSTDKAVSLHEKVVDELWRRALKARKRPPMRKIIAAAQDRSA